ncbi:MAG: reverse transcriptase domain-containing protein [Myxococcota bacterium]
MTFELPHLLAMARMAAKGKRRSPEVAAFMLDFAPKLMLLQQELGEHTYTPGTARPFLVHEPKRRLIASLPFRDRVVQHVLIHASMPGLERWFAPQSYACRVGKGTHRALRRAAELHRVFPWVLRIDIAKFFPSIDHDILLSIVLPRTPPELRWLAERIVRASGPCERVAFHFPGDELMTPHQRPHGLPIGNLTSQVWANAMLTPVDHLIASKIGIGTFVRYCDDILVYSHDRDRLEDAWDHIRERCDALRLRLHARKCRLHRTTEAVAFLGFVLRRRERGVVVRLRSENVRRFRSRTRRALALLDDGQLEADEVVARIRAWLAHARHGHTSRLRRSVLAFST